jgi:hypothetical protein
VISSCPAIQAPVWYRGLRAVLSAVLVLSSARLASAEITGATSVEWLSCAAEVIVNGTVRKQATAAGPVSVRYKDVTLDVEEVIKGDPATKSIEFTWRHLEQDSSPTWLKEGARVLVFLAKSKDHGPERRLDNRWVPLTDSGRPLVVGLSMTPDRIYSKEMAMVTDVDELLKIVRIWAKSPLKHSISMDVPWSSPIHNRLFGGSAVYLTVPAEEKYRLDFIRQARSAVAHERASAAKNLASYPGEETTAILQELLKDNSEIVSSYANDQIESVLYYVRAAAAQSLESLGTKVPDIALKRKPTDEEQRAQREQAWKRSFAEALKDGWTIAVADGRTRVLEGRARTIVVVTCQRGDERAAFTLVPKEWPANDVDVTGLTYLGTNGVNSQGGRRFYSHGELRGETANIIRTYFPLEKPDD